MEVEVLEKKETKTNVSQGAKLTLHNDNWNSFDHVIECLINVCKHHPHQAEQCTMLVHFKGECVVKIGDTDALNKMKIELETRQLVVTLDKD
jgi:ATP-dependent Clp protease adaptor protein ClpS